MTDHAYQPQYRRIEGVLRERIASLHPGERLPSDAELCAEFGVSRIAACAAAVLQADLEHGSLHETLARSGYALRRGTGTIWAAAADAADAQLLGVAVGSPLLVERRVIADSHGRRIEATESRYPADRYALDVRFDVEEPSGHDG